MVVPNEVVDKLLRNRRQVNDLSLGDALTFIVRYYSEDEFTVVLNYRSSRSDKLITRYVSIGEIAKMTRMAIAGQGYKHKRKYKSPLRDMNCGKFLDTMLRFRMTEALLADEPEDDWW